MQKKGEFRLNDQYIVDEILFSSMMFLSSLL